MARLRHELALCQRGLVRACDVIAALARDPARAAGAFFRARLDLNDAIRARRALITDCLALPVAADEARTARAEALNAKEQMLEIATRMLGQWPAARMEAERVALVASLDTFLPRVLALAAEEYAAVERYLAGIDDAPLSLNIALR